MSEVDLTDPIFHNEDKAREHLEATRWPDGPFCTHCGEAENIHRLQGKSNRPGLFQCNSCRETFSVILGSVMESSHVPLTKWVLVFHLMAASKKGISAKQIQRMLGVSYKTAWFLMHRAREAMSPAKKATPLGGKGKVLESDETFVGGRAKTAHKSKPIPKKHAVHALVERGGKVRASHVPDVSAKTLRKALAKNADRRSTLNTDDALANLSVGKDFAQHGTVVHTDGQYVSEDGLTHTQTVESFFAILKRGVMGSFHSVSEQHLQRYVDEFAFRWDNRSAMGVEDAERARRIVKGAIGKRLTYRQLDRTKGANNETEG